MACGPSFRTPACWPVVQQQHGPIARWLGVVTCSLRWGDRLKRFCAFESSLVVQLPGLAFLWPGKR